MSSVHEPNLVDLYKPSVIHFRLGKLSPPKLKHVVSFYKGFNGLISFYKGFYGFF